MDGRSFRSGTRSRIDQGFRDECMPGKSDIILIWDEAWDIDLWEIL
jgi:hypothetical protein